MEGREAIRRLWEKEMAERLKSGETEPFEDFITQKEYLEALKKYFEVSSLEELREKLRGKKFLDVGVGFGSRLRSLLKELGVEFLNLDVSKDAILYIQEKEEKGEVGDVYTLDEIFSEASFDGVICVNLVNVLCRTRKDLKEIFEKIYHVLKPGGIFIQSHTGFYRPETVVNFPQDIQVKILEESGFREISTIETKETEKHKVANPLSFIAQKPK